MPSYPVVELQGPPEDLELALCYLADWHCLGTAEGAGDRLRAYFPEGTPVSQVVEELGTVLPRVEARPTAPEPVRDWLAEWKESFTGFSLSERFFVLPTWKRRPVTARSILRLDPEQAFGTGTHDTTRLSVALLERLVREGMKVIDLGAGTGLLAMVAARLGAREVLAVEPDLEAARCARENVLRNGLSAAIRVEEAGYEDFELLEADLIVANILRPVLEGAVARMQAKRAILSGLLAEELELFSRAIPERFGIGESWTAGEWLSLVLHERTDARR